jgi:hypothetical protein
MSRGLGKLQRAILEVLPNHTADYADVYDLRAIKWALAYRCGAVYHDWCINGEFEASFSRAVCTLVKRGLLQRTLYQPIGHTPTRLHYTRWVKRGADIECKR